MILDTHVWLWYLADDAQLSSTLKQRIDDSIAECFISAISVWETVLLIERNRIKVGKGKPSGIVRTFLSRTPIQVAPINAEISLLSRELKLSHEDPADRFIAATAIAYDLPLVTADKTLLRAKELKTIAA